MKILYEIDFVYNFQKKYQMEEDFFVDKVDLQKSALLFESKWRRAGQSEVLDVMVYEDYITFCNKFLPFTFDLRFMTSSDRITFYQQEKEISFELVQDDQLPLA